MSSTLRSRFGEADHDRVVDALDELDGPAVRPTELAGRIWHLLISMKVGLGLILALVALTLIGTLIAQAPAGVLADPDSYTAWLDSMRPRYGGWTGVLSFLGLFSVFTSWLFKGIVLLLATSIIACSINRGPRLWKHAVHPRTTMGESFFHSASLHDTVELTVDPEAASELVRRVVHHHHYRVIPGRDSDGTLTVYADRWRWGPCGTVVAHLSFVVILLGFTASSLFGFKNSEFAVPVGTQVAVGNGTQLSVEATRFIDTYTADGSPLDYASDLVLYDGGREVGRQTVRVNQPMRYGGVSFYQSFFGVAASMKVTDARGAVVYSGGVPLTWQSDDGTHSIGQLPLPTQGLTVFVVGPASGQVDPDIKAGQMQIEVYRSGSDTPASVKVLDQGTPSTVEGLSYTFERTRRFTGLIVSRDPGAALVWLGSAMLVLGIVLVFFFPHRRVWVRITPVGAGSQVRVASILRRDLAFETQFQSIVHDVRLAGSPTSPAGK